MSEITREQIEAYRDSQSLLVTDFDREMARACLAALDRVEAAEQLCDTLTDEGGALAVAAQEARAEKEVIAKALDSLQQRWAENAPAVEYKRERDKARAEVERLRRYKSDLDEAVGALRNAARAYVGGNHEEVRRILCDMNAKEYSIAATTAWCEQVEAPLKAEVARLRDQMAALVYHAQQSGTYLAGPMAAAAAAWREQVRRELAEAVIALLDEHWPNTIGEANEMVARIRALAGAGEEKPK